MDKAPTISFAGDIRPLFTDIDVDHMSKLGLDLSDYKIVKDNSDAIYNAVQSGSMPPPGSGEEPWSETMCAIFKQWQSDGCPP